jgi:hypothetical protein
LRVPLSSSRSDSHLEEALVALRSNAVRLFALALALAGPARADIAPPELLVAVTDAGNELHLIDPKHPADTGGFGATITGLVVGDKIVSIDTRPATGALYGLGKNGTTLHLYRINAVTGVATKIGGDITVPLSTGASAGTYYAMDFNPVVDRIRVVSNTGDNFRLHPTTGAVVSADTKLTPPESDVRAIAYDQNHFGTTTTTLFGIDAGIDQLVKIGGTNGSPSPNGGAVTAVGALGAGAAVADVVGMEITPAGAAYALIERASNPGYTILFKLDLGGQPATEIAGIPPAFYTDLAWVSFRGDANGDGNVDVADVFYLINFLFAGAPPPVP